MQEDNLKWQVIYREGTGMYAGGRGGQGGSKFSPDKNDVNKLLGKY